MELLRRVEEEVVGVSNMIGHSTIGRVVIEDMIEAIWARKGHMVFSAKCRKGKNFSSECSTSSATCLDYVKA